MGTIETAGTTYLKAALNNGLGRHVCQLKRATFRLCKEWGGSFGARKFVELDLLDVARANPGVVYYVKPRRHRSANIFCEYLNGQDQSINVSFYSRFDIVKWMEHARTRCGYDVKHLTSHQLSYTLSTQGMWNPFTYTPTSANMLSYPSEPGLRPLRGGKNASEVLLERYAEQTGKDHNDLLDKVYRVARLSPNIQIDERDDDAELLEAGDEESADDEFLVEGSDENLQIRSGAINREPQPVDK